MLWWIGTITGGIAAWRFFGADLTALGWISVGVGVAGLWTAGIAANFGRGEEQMIPDGATRVNILTTVGGIILLIISFVT